MGKSVDVRGKWLPRYVVYVYDVHFVSFLFPPYLGNALYQQHGWINFMRWYHSCGYIVDLHLRHFCGKSHSQPTKLA